MSTSKVKINGLLVDFENQRLERDGQFVDLDGQALKVLAVLIEHSPRTVSRDELLEQAWPGIVVSDNSVSQAIASLRKAFADDSRDPRFIRTVARKGYQLVAEVDRLEAESPIPKSRPQWRLMATFALVMILVLGLVLAGSFDDENASELYIPSEILSSDPGTEAFLRISPDGQWLAYSESPNSARGYDLVLRNLVNGERRVVLDSDADEYIGDWSPDQRWLAYVIQDDVRCEIYAMDLQKKFAPHQKLMSCVRAEFPPRVRWSRNNKVYVAANYQLQQISLGFDADASSFTALEQKQISGLSPELLELSSSERYLWVSEINHRDLRYQLIRYDLGLDEKIVVDDSISGYWGMSALNDEEVLVGGISLEKIHLREGKTVVYHSSQYIVDVTSHPQAGIVVSEAKPDVNLKHYNLTHSENKTGDIKKGQGITGSTQVDYLPALAHDKRRYAFVSGRNNKDGLGVWLGDFEGGRESLLANLEGILPIALSWSPSDRYMLLVSNQRELFIVDVESGAFNLLSETGTRAYFPHWDVHEDRIYFNRREQDQWQLVQLHAPTWRGQNQVIEFPQLHRHNESIVVFEEQQSAVYRVRNGGEKTLLLNYEAVDELSFDRDRMLSFANEEGELKIKVTTLESGESYLIDSLTLAEFYGNVPKKSALQGESLMLTEAGQHQVDMVLLAKQKNN